MLGFLSSGLDMKNSFIDMLKEPVVNQETARIQREYFEKMKKDQISATENIQGARPKE